MSAGRVVAPEIESPFLTVDEAAAYLRLTARALENFRQVGGGPLYRKHGGRVVYHRDELDEWSAQLRYAYSGAVYRGGVSAAPDASRPN